MSGGGSWIHKEDLIGEEAVDIKRRRMSHCIIHAGQMIPLTHYRCEARLWVHKKIVGNGERELMTIRPEHREDLERADQRYQSSTLLRRAAQPGDCQLNQRHRCRYLRQR